MICLFLYAVIFLASIWMLRNTFRQIPRKFAAKKPLLDEFFYKHHPEVAERLAQAITFQTISRASDETETGETLKLLAFLEKQFPLMHGQHELVTYDVINEFSRLYKVQGSDPNAKAYLFNAHTDVVPVDDQNWSSDPFNTGIKDGWIFGRGALDDKGSVLALMESISYLLRTGYKPKKTIYVAICHDEEVWGVGGAKAIADLLEERGVTLEFVHDEGMMIFNELFPGFNKEVAIIGVTEKGYVDVEVSLKLTGAAGHSSASKPGVGVLGKLGHVAHAAEKRQMTMHLNAPTIEMFNIMSTEMSLPLRFIFRNMKLFWPILRYAFGKTVLANLFRTTSAVTMFSGGTKQNVLPSEGKFIINHRIHPDDSVEKVLQRDKSLLIDEHMQITALRPDQPQPTAPFDENAIGYHAIKAAIEQFMGADKVVVVPGLMIGATDSRHYSRLTDACYRFLPTRLKVSEAHRFHGHDEKISVENYAETINFYVNLIRNADATSVDQIYKI